MTKMTKYQLEHFESKVNRYFEPLISEQQLLIKQYNLRKACISDNHGQSI